MNVGIIGKGTVGSAVYEGFRRLGHDLSVYDPKITQSQMSDVLHTDLVYVCVPTDSTEQGLCDISIVDQVCQELNLIEYQGLVCIKSTVIPGTTDQLIQKYPNIRMCVVPEFLRAASALGDFINDHDVLVIGAYQKEYFDLIKISHGHYPKTTICVTPAAAEMTKYFHNVHNAMEITFANVINGMCKQLNIDYQQVYAAVTKRSNINGTYLRAGDQWGAFGGHCLPKDTLALHKLQNQLGLNYSLIQAILSDNQRFQK